MTTIPDLDKEGKVFVFFVFNLALSEFQFIMAGKAWRSSSLCGRREECAIGGPESRENIETSRGSFLKDIFLPARPQPSKSST